VSDEDRLPPLFLGLFRELVAQGVPVSVRDYLDGIRALRFGFGHGDRERLCALARTLWARSDEERRIVNRWFDVLPRPPQALVDRIEETYTDTFQPQLRPGSPPETSAPAPVPSVPKEKTGQAATPGAEAAAPRARVSFGGAHEGGGLPVPRLPVEPAIDEDYVLHPQTLISARDLAVLWRRYRRSTRRGPHTEMDLESTIRERCRRGLLRQPVLRPRRGNSARLLVLADTSASMDPWRPFLDTLADSLHLGRFARSEILYFGNLPRRQLFATPHLTESKPTDDVLRRHAGASLLVVSDAGSARGYLNRRRTMQTAAFLDKATRFFPATVWLNPMPQPRWAGTTASLLASRTLVTMLPLDAAHLLRAVDVLRGNK
jgi:uncharacterized protein with von Willebrand factor type A (vWA) domain